MLEETSKTDFKQEKRPETRLQQFFDIAKHRFLELVKLSLLQTVFNVPLFVSLIIFYALVRNATNINSLMTVFLIQGASFIISLPFSYIGMTGTFHSMKLLAYAEGEFASSSFFYGLRDSWKKGLLIGLFMGLSATILLIGFFFAYFYLSEVNSSISGFAVAIITIQFIVMLIVSYYSLGQITIYENNLKYVYKNAFILTLMRFPINLLLVILYPGIIIVLFCIMDITMCIGVLLAIFFAVFGHLIWMLNSISAFDKFINREKYPDYYHKGLYNKNNLVKED